jgi:ribosomal protein S8
MMEEYIIADRVANAIMMDNSFKGFYLVVEGVKDYNLFSKFFDKNNVKIKEAFGCEKVKSVLEILKREGYSNRFGIIDSDFGKILNVNHNVDGLFITDSHDIEVMIIKTNALESVLRIFTSAEKIENFERRRNQTIRSVIMELGAEIGYLKLAHKIYDLGLIFKPHSPEGNQIRYRDFIDERDNLRFKGRASLVQTLLNYSNNKTPNLKSEQEITERLNEIAAQSYDIEQLVNGHDLTNILYLLIKKVFVSTSRMLNDFNAIESSLTLAYEYEDFKQTDLYSKIKSFEDALQTTILK